MNRQRHGLLLELIFVCGFFILASCIFVLVFFKAGQLSTLSRDTSAAVNAAQTIVEGIYPPEGENAAESREYTLSLDHMDANARVSETWDDGLVHIEITIYSGDGTEKELYRLSADRDFS